MNITILFSTLIILVNYHSSFGQMLSCSYRIDKYTDYSCDLTIQNPNGLNNFTEISGTHLPGKTNNDIRYIRRNSGSTINIPSIICDTFQYMKWIDLESFGIQTVNDFSFKNCKERSFLSLFNNKITSVEENSFSENKEFLTLTLDQNYLTTLPENVFANQQKLETLRLNINGIADFPKNIFNSLTSLTRLDITHNPIEKLRNEWFQNLEKLKYLYLSSNQIEELPRNVFSPLKNILYIFLENNKFKVIHSDAFGILPNLILIYAFENQIDAIDERFIDNTGVQRLDVRNNLCVNVSIFDNSTSRQSMRNTLQTCFDNYNALYSETTTITSSPTEEQTTTEDPASTSQTSSPGCNDGNLDERVCRLEDKNEDLEQQIKVILQEKEEMQENLENQIKNLQKNFNEAFEELQNQILILSTRPCSCH